MRPLITPGDVLFTLLLLAACAAGAVATLAAAPSGPAEALVLRDGRRAGRLPLDRDGRYVFGDWTVTVRNGAAAVTASTCPRGHCLRQGAVRTAGRSVVCVPNRMVLEIVSPDRGAQVDAVAR